MFKAFSLLMILMLGLTACKKDSADPANCGANWATAVSTEWSDVMDAATAYSEDPTSTTCSAYKAAYQDYVDALKPFLDCSAWTAQQRADVQAAIDEAESNIETLCDE